MHGMRSRGFGRRRQDGTQTVGLAGAGTPMSLRVRRQPPLGYGRGRQADEKTWVRRQ
jgi:hypothetical protein